MIDTGSIKKEYNELLEELASPELISDWEKFQNLTKRKNFLEKIIDRQKEISEIDNKIKENQSIITANEDRELVSLAEVEIIQLREKEKKLKAELEDLLNADFIEDEPDSNTPVSDAAIIEIRAGTGGNEAALFAGDLYRMYFRYSQTQNWKSNILDSSATELGGFKEIVFGLEGNDVLSGIKYEAGVHRVQRIPKTEKAGRIHTSTASVAILPKPKKTEIKINPKDLKIDFYGAAGPGGQYVQKRHTAVRITHLPTGTVVTSQTERNQLQNRENAMSILEARLFEKQKTNEEERISGKRKTQIGSAKRAEKIRTYNFPQNRLTDHRIKKSWHNLEKIMNGELKPVIKDLQKNL